MNVARLGGVVLGVTLVGNLVAQPLRAVRDLRDTDFAVFGSASRILASGSHCLYCLSTQRASLAAYVSQGTPGTWNLFVYPPPAAWILRPLAPLPPTVALAIFVSAALVCVMLAGLLLYRGLLRGVARPRAALLTIAAVASLPAAWGVALGQWTPIVALPVALAVILIHRKEHHVVAGLLLSLALVKPQLVVLVPFALVATREWRVLTGFGTGVCVWTAASFLLIGERALDWIGLVAQQQQAIAGQSISVPGGLAWLTHRPGGALIAFVALLPVAIVATMYVGRRLHDPAALVALALVGSLLIAPHLNADDFILCAPALALWGGRQPVAALIAALSLSLAFLLDAAVNAPAGAHLETIAVAGVLIGGTRALMRDTEQRHPEQSIRVRESPLGTTGREGEIRTRDLTVPNRAL